MNDHRDIRLEDSVDHISYTGEGFYPSWGGPETEEAAMRHVAAFAPAVLVYGLLFAVVFFGWHV